MAELPSYVTVLFPGYGETVQPNVERTEMERGIPKQRNLSTGVMVELSCVFRFRNLSDAAAFDAWYMGTIRRIGSFTMQHPRTLTPIEVRFKGGDIGTLTPTTPIFAACQRDVVLEYYQP